MSKKRAWVIPPTLPASYDCRVLLLPDDFRWLAIFSGVLDMLTESENFEQLGDVTPDQAARVFGVTWDQWTKNDEVCIMFAGMVVAAAVSAAPSDRWIACDGAEYASVDYPALFAAIGTAFGSSGPGLFCVPDLASRLPLGAGDGSGLTPRTLADSGGEETHVLSADEMPQHYHTIPDMYKSGVASGGTYNAYRYQAGSLYTTNNAGSNAAHNTMPPYLVLNFFIYAG